jgi:hypothetical protein
VSQINRPWGSSATTPRSGGRRGRCPSSPQRLGQYLVYPPLTWLVRLPKYNTAEWVNVSRHKFEGLVGHDLIWCLYCDWMTGVWSLGTEMLRNVESFWCPIRFRSDKKCENCTLDFPDLDNGWAPADGTMADVVKAHARPVPGAERGERVVRAPGENKK